MTLRPRPQHIFALSLLALAAHAGAADYYMVAPLRSARSGSAATQPPAPSVSLTLSSFVPTPGAEGTPYQLDLRGLTQLTGGALDAVTYNLAGGSLPAGLTLGSNGTISGTPTGATPAEGQLATVQASYGGKTAQQSYLFSMEAMSITLATATLPDAKVGKPYSFDFKSLATVKGGTGIANATFARQGSALPQGLALGADGVLAGTPAAGSATTGAGTGFTVVGTYLSKTGQQVYTIKVGDSVLEVVQVAGGDVHTCAVTTGGALKCWGFNNRGRLGDGTLTQRIAPVQVQGLTSGVTAVTAGASHTCAIVTGGALKCWGGNDNGQLGDGQRFYASTPVQVQGLTSGVTAVTAGASHTCAIVAGGALKCWGANSTGQLGDSTTADRTAPVAVTGLTSGVTAVTAGASHTCAIAAGGALRCLGRNGNGQLGDGTMADRTAPVAVQGLTSGVTAVSAGASHTCAIATGGALKCWGNNFSGILGNGNTNSQTSPVQVLGLTSGVTAVTTGTSHTCAIAAGAESQCWGGNYYGQLGDGTTVNRNTPGTVKGN